MTSFASLTCRQGETLAANVFIITNPDGSPYDLSGCTAHLSVRSLPSDTSPLVDLTDANGGLVIGTAAGTITPIVTAATTAAWAAGVYEYDLFVTFADGSRQCAEYGAFYVPASNTRNP